MSERQVLALLANNRGAYEQYAAYLEDEDFSSIGRTVYSFLRDYYERDPDCTSVDVSDIKHYLDTATVKGSSEANGLLEWDGVSLPNVEEAVRRQQLQARGYKLAEILLTNDVEHATLPIALEEYYSIYTNTYIHSSSRDTDDDILDLLASLERDNLIKIYPHSLNEHLDGGVTKGTTITIFARPEMGKSLMSINATAGWLRDGHKVLYVGNEDPKAKMITRILGRIAGWTKHEVLAKPKDALAIAKEKGFDNLDFRALTPGTMTELDQLVRTTEPDIVVLDQIFNFEVKGAEIGSIQAIRQLAPKARTIGKSRDVVMWQVTQAGDSGEGKIELCMGDIEGTNTAHQAQQDIIIGVGGNEQMKRSGHRTLTFPKNKESGDHEPLPVRFEDAINKVHSI